MISDSLRYPATYGEWQKPSHVDIPGLSAAAGGTGVYIANTPDLVEKSKAAAEEREKRKHEQPRSPASHLIPFQGNPKQAHTLHYLTCSMIVSSPLQAPGKK